MLDLLSKFKKVIDYINPFSISSKLDEIHQKIYEYQDYKCQLSEEYTKLKEDLEKERELRKQEQKLTVAVLDHLPDLLWAKDLSGKYILCNRAFREKFCYGLSWKEIKGRTDVELAEIFKSRVGSENHTFGELCKSSDQVVIETEEAREFLENGLIDGKLIKLVVSKAPIYGVDGEFYATCGSGRDVTEWYNSLEIAIQDSNACFGKEGRELLLRELNKLEFTLDDNK